MTISGKRTEQFDIFCRVTSDFLSFIDVELIRFFHGAIHLLLMTDILQHICICFLRMMIEVVVTTEGLCERTEYVPQLGN